MPTWWGWALAAAWLGMIVLALWALGLLGPLGLQGAL